MDTTTECEAMIIDDVTRGAIRAAETATGLELLDPRTITTAKGRMTTLDLAMMIDAETGAASMAMALRAIADMEVDEDADHAQLLALCMAVAKTELGKMGG